MRSVAVALEEPNGQGSSPCIEVVNVVARVQLGERIDLSALKSMPFVTFSPRMKRCAYLRIDGVRGHVAIFPSGKLILAGARSEEEARSGLLRTAFILGERGIIKATKLEIEVVNMVVIINMNSSLDIISIARTSRDLIYEPEQFPGAIFRPKELRGASMLLFHTGKVVLAGIKSGEEIKRSVSQLLRLREPYHYSAKSEVLLPKHYRVST